MADFPYTPEQLADPAFYQANKSEIWAAVVANAKQTLNAQAARMRELPASLPSPEAEAAQQAYMARVKEGR
ncbi:hypothetical protein SPF06_02495 [Sinomonas sp. JGH33]|uniref:Uncharacterized protein n=1 Tax=Sinomonas terricola TaxID=3110330 RepID=A0ABU5T200_9MICC|nr:hypothetical protein [Sinomonas sp. JGH33]MEA5453582.1 hypothetical protein [Sinomonas sp. JGH33]